MKRGDVLSTFVLKVRCSGVNNRFCRYMQRHELEMKWEYKAQHLKRVNEQQLLDLLAFCVSCGWSITTHSCYCPDLKTVIYLNMETTEGLCSSQFTFHCCVEPATLCFSGISESEHWSFIRARASWVKPSHVL